MVEPLKPGDPRRVGRYRLVGYLGGGMGRVYLGRSQIGKPVAVKVIRSEYGRDPEFRERFAREVDAARRVGRHFTAEVVDADPSADPPWMATEYIAGPSLRAAVSKAGPLPADVVRTLGAALAEGLSAIHDHGVVHRDVKPDNVVLDSDGPRIIDFGIARALDASTITASGAVFGTSAYMSPEQANGFTAGPTSDVFALGSLLTYAATGQAPFGDGQDPAILHRIINAPPNLDAVPYELREVIAACLDKAPRHRIDLADVIRRLNMSGDGWPQSITDMIAAVVRETDDALAAASEAPVSDATTEPPTSDHTPASPERPAKAVRRPGRRVLLVGAAAAVCVAGALATWFSIAPLGDRQPSRYASPTSVDDVLLKSAAKGGHDCVRHITRPLPGGRAPVGGCEPAAPEWSMWAFPNGNVRFVSRKLDGVCWGADTEAAERPVGTWSCYRPGSAWARRAQPDGSYHLENERATADGSPSRCATRRGSVVVLDVCGNDATRKWFLVEPQR